MMQDRDQATVRLTVEVPADVARRLREHAELVGVPAVEYVGAVLEAASQEDVAALVAAGDGGWDEPGDGRAWVGRARPDAPLPRMRRFGGR
jgi:hypothetical protein